jgi:transmembrane sensor
MEATPDQARELAAEEATTWLIALQEEPENPALRRRFEAWLKASSLNEAAWLRTQRLLGMAENLHPRHSDKWQGFVTSRRDGEVAQGLGRQNAPRISWFGRPRQRWIAGVGLAAAAMFAFVITPAVLVRLQADYLTATAELRTIELDDGSTVTLAAASAIAVSFASQDRQVTLVEGEAFFRVRSDPARPFRVVAGSVRTTVVGTSFDVRRDSSGVTINVEQGIVQVASTESGAEERLEAGDAVRVDWHGKAVRSTDPTPVAAGWRQGQLLAQNRSLRDAVDQLRRYYGGSIILTDDTLGARRITGVYNLADPEEALRAIAGAHGAKVRRITPWVLMISAN